jgi:hypothetical protein
MGNRRVAYRIVVGRNDEKRTLGRPKRRREDNIKMELQKKLDGKAWTLLVCLRIGTDGAIL